MPRGRSACVLLLLAAAGAFLLVPPILLQATTYNDRYDNDENFALQGAPCVTNNAGSDPSLAAHRENSYGYSRPSLEAGRDIEIQELELHLKAIDPPLRLLFLHRRDKKNIGDWACTPKWYFDLFRSQDHDHKDLGYCPGQKKLMKTAHEYDGIVIGGGGLLRCSHFWDGTLSILAKHPGAVLWSAGTNFVLKDINNISTNPLVPEYVRDFPLYGIRDELFLRSSPKQYHRQLDDVTCMSPLFDKHYPSKASNDTNTLVVGIYAHHTHPIDEVLPCSFTSSKNDVLAEECAQAGCLWTNENRCQFESKVLSNKGIKLEEAIEFLATSNVVVTSSYHGLWWATLLGKPVLLHPDTWVFTKEMFFAYPPSMFTGDLAQDLRRARTYPHALAHCRKQNRQFYLEFLRLLRQSRESGILPPSPHVFLPYNISDPTQDCITLGTRSRCAATGQHTPLRIPETPFVDRRNPKGA